MKPPVIKLAKANMFGASPESAARPHPRSDGFKLPMMSKSMGMGRGKMGSPGPSKKDMADKAYRLALIDLTYQAVTTGQLPIEKLQANYGQ